MKKMGKKEVEKLKNGKGAKREIKLLQRSPEGVMS